MTATHTTPMTWQAPGPGQWTASTDHWHRPITPIMGEAMRATFGAGFHNTLKRFGAPLDRLAGEFVNGIMYVRPVPVIDKPGSKAPPKIILRLVCLLHPELRRRSRVATRLLADETWRERMDEWRTTERPWFTERNRALQQVHLADLDDATLLHHLDETIEHLHLGLLTHFEIAPVETAPFGLLCVESRRWGLEAEDLLQVLVGASPATTAPSHDLEPLRAELTRRGVQPTSLEEVRAASPAAATLLDDWLADRRWLVSTGYDVDDLTLGEMPQVVLAAINAPAPPPPPADPAGLFRDQIPETDRARFDHLVDGAREAFGLRDENGPLTGEWPVGLVRRGLLELGRRLHERGVLDVANLATVATRDEVERMLVSGDTSAARAVEHRQAQRLLFDLATVPSVLGDPEPEPDPDALPGALGVFANAAMVILGLELAAARRLATMAATAEPGVLHGTGIGSDFVRGRARVARTPDDLLDGLEPGDIVVTPATSPTWNVLLSAATGLVVEEGGLTGHAAIVAREFGLPTIIGVKGAANRIVDGAEIQLDTVAGEVRLG